MRVSDLPKALARDCHGECGLSFTWFWTQLHELLWCLVSTRSQLVSIASNLPTLQRFGPEVAPTAFPGHHLSICPKRQMLESDGLMLRYLRQKRCSSSSICFYCSGNGKHLPGFLRLYVTLG